MYNNYCNPSRDSVQSQNFTTLSALERTNLACQNCFQIGSTLCSLPFHMLCHMQIQYAEKIILGNNFTRPDNHQGMTGIGSFDDNKVGNTSLFVAYQQATAKHIEVVGSSHIPFGSCTLAYE